MSECGSRERGCATMIWRAIRSSQALFWYMVAIFVLMTDQLVKLTIVHTFTYGEQVEITSFFNLVYVLNPGAAFSFLADAGGWQRGFLILMGLVVSAWLMHTLYQRPPRLEALGYSLVLGGALGNVADRVLRGQVVDFVDFHWLHAHWPAFNLADVAIVSGTACLFAVVLVQRVQRRPTNCQGDL